MYKTLNEEILMKGRNIHDKIQAKTMKHKARV